jgi:hypothetical protein
MDTQADSKADSQADSKTEADPASASAPQNSLRAVRAALPPAATLARGIGWFSVALGIAQLLAPRAMSRAVGLEARVSVTRLYGLRELMCGIGILASRDPKPFLWARVGGDALDLGTLAAASSGRGAGRRTMMAAANVACVTALDVYAASQTNCAASAVKRRQSPYDYSERSGFARSPSAMRGAALADFEIPRDMRTPEALQSFTRNTGPAMGQRRRPGSVPSQG